MTEKQKRFAEEYMKTGNSRQAYINAGYSGTERSIDVNASRLLNSDKVQKYIHQISDEIKNRKIADIQEMQEVLSNIIRGLTTEEVIVTELIGDGVSKSKIMKRKPSLRDVIKACEVLGRMTGAYTNTVNLVLPVYGGEEDLED